MPTLQSVRVAPELLQKLQDQVTPPIQTPLALLSRDAASTAQQLNVPLHYWQQVRSRVADALLIRTSTETVRIAQQQSTDDETCTADPGEPTQTEDTSLIVGSLTALEYWRHSQLIHSSPLTIHACTALKSWLSLAQLIQFTGPHASGKTQVCLSLAVQHALVSSSQQVLYITTTTPPASLARRLRQLVSSCSNQKDVLSRIDLVSLSTPHQLLAAFQKVVDERENDVSSQLLVLDSVSGCLGGCSDWNLLQQVGLALKRLVHLHGLQIVMTNGTTSSGESALGQAWSQVAETRIRFDVVSDEQQPNKIVRATLQSLDNQIGETMDFIITAGGIEDVVAKE